MIYFLEKKYLCVEERKKWKKTSNYKTDMFIILRYCQNFSICILFDITHFTWFSYLFEGFLAI